MACFQLWPDFWRIGPRSVAFLGSDHLLTHSSSNDSLASGRRATPRDLRIEVSKLLAIRMSPNLLTAIEGCCHEEDSRTSFSHVAIRPKQPTHETRTAARAPGRAGCAGHRVLGWGSGRQRHELAHSGQL